tara:strand:+ start:309 stop:572 length:264 start_codon:yes stop_codon:yes gene_type:complete
MLGLIFNIKRRGVSFFVLVPTRPAILAEMPLFCRIRISVIKTAKDSSLSGKRGRYRNAYGDIRFRAGTSMALIYKINLSVNLTKALQ